MDTSEELDEHFICASDAIETKFESGTRNWGLLLFISLCLCEVVENYLTYGIIKTPLDLTTDFIHFFCNWGWVFPVIFLSLALQLVLCICIEKLIFWKYIDENVGLVFHIFNTFLVLNVLAYISTYSKLNCVFGNWMAGNCILLAIKLWSFSSENRNLRLKKTSIEIFHDDYLEVTHYPANIKLKNLVTFIIGSGNFLYQPNGYKKKPLDWKRIFALIVQIIAILYITAFIIYQYGITTSDEMIKHISSKNYTKCVGLFFKLLVIVCIVWVLIFYQYVFKCYLPLLSLMCGNEDALHMKSWWNSTNMSNVWSSWNVQSHYVFKYHVFKPLIEAGCKKHEAFLTVTLISGFMHEYMVTVPFRSGYGAATTAMLLQILTCFVTSCIQKKFGNNAGNFSTLGIHFIWQTSCYFYVYYHYIYNEYGGLN